MSLMPTDRTVNDPDAARTPAAIEDLIADFRQDGGCPCRFPRFRATVGRSTSAFGAELMTWEQYLLITVFDRKVKLLDRRSLILRGGGAGYEADCASCGAVVARRSLEVVRDRWIEFMAVRPKGVEDLGAAADGALPHCWPFFAIVGGELGREAADRAKRDAEITYPRISLDEWIAWMKVRQSAVRRTGY
jgi:hypothetical protein